MIPLFFILLLVSVAVLALAVRELQHKVTDLEWRIEELMEAINECAPDHRRG